MNKLTIVSILVLGSFLAGCGASHEDVYNAKDPSGHMKRQCWETGNGSTRCATDIESKFVGGAMGGTGYGYGGLSGVSAHPPILMAPGMVQMTEAERAMEDVPGGMVVMHPMTASGQGAYTMPQDQDTLLRSTLILRKRVEAVERKVDQKDAARPSQPSTEATGK